MELFRLYGSILIDNKEALKELGITTKQAKASQKAMQDLVDGAQEFGKKIVVGAAAAATAMTGIVLKFTDAASDISDASKRVGMSAEEYQKWSYAAKLSGIEADKLESLMKKQQTVFSDAAAGSKKASDAYAALGIDITKIGNSSEAFNLVVERLAGMEDATKRNELANDLFGKSYADLAPLLAEGAAGIEALRNEAVAVGAVMSNEAVEAGDQFGDTLDRLKAGFEGIVNQLAIALLPYFQQLVTWIEENKPAIQDFAQAVIGGLASAFKWVADNLNWLLPIIVGVVAAFATFSIVNTIIGMITTFNTIIAGATGIMGIFNAVMAANPAVLIALGVGALIAVVLLLWKNWDKVSKWMGDSFKWLANGFIGVVNTIIDGINSMIKAFLWPFNLLIKGFNNTIGKITGSIPEIKIEIPNIPKLAKGGIAYDETLAMVGEYPNAKSDPEVIAPLSQLKNIIGGTIDYDELGRAIARYNRNLVVVLDGEKVGEIVDARILKGAY